MRKYKLLDLYCGAGGCARGYQQAGFYVVGVDDKRQPRYAGDKFVQADALQYCLKHGDFYDAIHASPPCQKWTAAKYLRNNQHPDLITPTRDLLLQLGKPYVIENVPGAPLHNPVTLNGLLFALLVVRERLFETNWPLPQPPLPEFTGKRAKMGRPPKQGEYITVVGHFSGADYARQAMQTPWMVKSEMAQAIPPAYTRYVGEHLLRYLQKQAAIQRFMDGFHQRLSI